MKSVEIRRIKDAQNYIGQLYPNKDRDTSYIFSYAVRHVGYLSKALTQRLETEKEFLRSFSWLIALANNLSIDLEEAILQRYPGVCPYCHSTRCVCVKTGKKPNQQMPAYKIPEELFYLAQPILREPHSFHRASDVISEVYPNNLTTWDAIGAWKHTSKFSEELAEIHEAYSKYFAKKKPISAVAEEFADLFAWLLTAWRIALPNVNVDESFITYYQDGCPVCARHVNCNCSRFSDLSANLVDPKAIEKLNELFLALAKEAGETGDEINEIAKSLQSAAETQSEPIARTAVEQTKEKVASIERALESGAKNSKNAGVILSSIYKLLETLGFL